jgi:hypothetical protein
MALELDEPRSGIGSMRRFPSNCPASIGPAAGECNRPQTGVRFLRPGYRPSKSPLRLPCKPQSIIKLCTAAWIAPIEPFP